MSPQTINRHSRASARFRHSRAGGNPVRNNSGTHHQQRHPRPAFTLIELVLVLAIIGILASALLGALYSTQEAARAQRTKVTIAKLDSAIRAQWDTYRTRRVAINRGTAEGARAFAARQLQARWDLQRAEMPDRFEDIRDDPAGANNPMTLAYKDAIDGFRIAQNARKGTSLDFASYLSAIIATNKSSECLYLTITVGMNPMDEIKFIEAEIGDTDDDGMPEFIDGYGEPINFLRWAPGFISDIQKPNPELWPDPFDPLGVGRQVTGGPTPEISPPNNPPSTSYGYLMYPLIYSAGPDGAGALMLLGSVDTSVPENQALLKNPYSFYDFNGNPYQRGALNPGDTTEGGGPYDNIHNHLLGTR